MRLLVAPEREADGRSWRVRAIPYVGWKRKTLQDFHRGPAAAELAPAARGSSAAHAFYAAAPTPSLAATYLAVQIDGVASGPVDPAVPGADAPPPHSSLAGELEGAAEVAARTHEGATELALSLPPLPSRSLLGAPLPADSPFASLLRPTDASTSLAAEASRPFARLAEAGRKRPRSPSMGGGDAEAEADDLDHDLRDYELRDHDLDGDLPARFDFGEPQAEGGPGGKRKRCKMTNISAYCLYVADERQRLKEAHSPLLAEHNLKTILRQSCAPSLAPQPPPSLGAPPAHSSALATGSSVSLALGAPPIRGSGASLIWQVDEARRSRPRGLRGQIGSAADRADRWRATERRGTAPPGSARGACELTPVAAGGFGAGWSRGAEPRRPRVSPWPPCGW